MNVTRIAILGVALLAGAAAFFLMMGNRSDNAPVQIVEPVREQTTRVLVSLRTIERGERITLEDTQWIAWPVKAVQEHFITDANPEAREELVDAVARSLIIEGEPMLNQKVVKAGQSGLMAAMLAPGMRAITVRVSPETSSGGFILPGDRVDVHYTEADEGNGNETNIALLKENVRVLAINTIYSEHTETPAIEGRNVTLELNPNDAEYFMIARNSRGTIQLTLRSIFEPEGEVISEAEPRSDVRVIRYGRS